MLGIFGGTFDPVHYGHLEPVKVVCETLGLEQVLFIPNNIPPHRGTPELGTAQRVELLQLALLDYPMFAVDLREVQREGPSYTVDTLTSLKQENPDQTLVLIIGMDAFTGFTGWYHWQDIIELCHLVVTTRPGYPAPLELDERLQQRLVDDAAALTQGSAGRILVKSTPLLDISSTGIRSELSAGGDAREIMPESVYLRYREMIATYATR